MNSEYVSIIQTLQKEELYKVPRKHTYPYPTGFVVITDVVQSFPFTVCPLYFCKLGDPLPGKNPHDVIVFYDGQGSLEKILYTLYEEYRETGQVRTSCSAKRYIHLKTLPLRKIVIPCLKRIENLEAVLQRFQQIDMPVEGYRPQILLVEHSPYPEMDKIAGHYGCEWMWFPLLHDPRQPLGQFNKALCYDLAFLEGTPAIWYLFHDNDILVPKDFWLKLDQNHLRTGSRFIQPYTHRCLLNLKEEHADRYRKDPSLVDKGVSFDLCYPMCRGAPGGSLYLHHDRYLEAGGHDPNYCWGYGPEDSFFFYKLGCIEPIAYADEPAIEMVHLWHPSADVTNPFRNDMDLIIKGFFLRRSLEETRAYMNKNKQLLLQLMKREM